MLPNAKFKLGQTVSTHGALEALEENGIAPIAILARHVSGDWSEMDPEDRFANERAIIADVETGEFDRVLSSYKLPKGGKIWCITEWDRSVTTILLPSEY